MADFDAQPGRAPQDHPSAAQREADALDLHAGLSGVAQLVAGAGSVEDLLGDVAALATQALPGVDGVSVVLLQLERAQGRIKTRIATAAFVAEIDDVQYTEIQEGPCITCMQTGRVTVSGSLGSDSRWPRFGGRVARMSVHSALSLPLTVGDEVIGSINAYAHTRDAFGEHAAEQGAQFARPAAVSVYNAQLLAAARERTDHLRRALASRAVIDQAIGIIRSRSGADADQAFERLKQLSQTANVKLVVVAEQLVEEAVRRARARHRA